MGCRECCLTCRHAVHECDNRAGEIECYLWDQTRKGQTVCDDYWSLLDRYHLSAFDSGVDLLPVTK